MKHEKFQIFRVASAKINSDELTEFLNSGDVIPKSISIDKYYQGQKIILIGYEEEFGETDHPDSQKYYLHEEKIGDIGYHGLSGLGELIEAAAEKVGGVICQDIEYLEDEVVITFLTTKQ